VANRRLHSQHRPEKQEIVWQPPGAICRKSRLPKRQRFNRKAGGLRRGNEIGLGRAANCKDSPIYVVERRAFRPPRHLSSIPTKRMAIRRTEPRAEVRSICAALRGDVSHQSSRPARFRDYVCVFGTRSVCRKTDEFSVPSPTAEASRRHLRPGSRARGHAGLARSRHQGIHDS
jgi:hypothetical protein